jgi:hypothetical protein
MTDSSVYLQHNGMFHLEISKFHRKEPPVQEYQFGLLKIPADDQLIIQKISPKIITEVSLQFHYICWPLSKLQTLLCGHVLPKSRHANMLSTTLITGDIYTE